MTSSATNLYEEDTITADCADTVDFAIAYGAALVHSDKAHRANFRDDFNPYQGKKLKLQKMLKFAAVSVTALLITIGLYLQIQLVGIKRDSNSLRSKFSKDYSAVSLDKLSEDDSLRDAARKLDRLLRRIEAEKKGLITDEKSISSKLTLVLSAFNKCAEQTNLNIDTITITTRDITIIGDTSSRQNTIKFFEKIVESGLERVQERYVLKGNRDTFTLKAVPRK
jgi:hypothetical protein